MIGMPESPSSTKPGRLYARLAGLAVATAAGVGLVGWWPVHAGLNGALRVPAWSAGVALALVAVLAGLLPAALLAGSDPRQRLNGILAGMMVRFVVLLGLLVPMLLLTGLPRLPLALGAAIAYLVLLAAETTGQIWLERRARDSA